MFFTNKHVIIAMLVAPMLALLAWFSVGELKGEKAAPATAGKSYPLVEMSNCRYESGRCGLENEEFKLEMTLREEAGQARLSLQAAHSLEGVMVSVGPAESDMRPQAMHAGAGDGRHWNLELAQMPGPDDRIRLVASREGSRWFGEATTRFIEGNDGGMGLTR